MEQKQIEQTLPLPEQQPTPQAVQQPPKPAQLPAQLQPLAGCFANSKKAFLAAFTDPKQGEVTFAKEINFCSQAMLNNQYLITCAKNNPEDLVAAIRNVALTGTTLNPTLALAYLVPFKGRIKLMPSYMGLSDLLVNSGIVRKIEAHPVFRCDKFDMMLGSQGYIKHQPDPWGERSPQTLLGCYYYVVLADGTEMFDTLSKTEIDAIKQRSPSVAKGQSSPWDTDYIEMAKKTAIRRAFKACPKSGISDAKLKAVEAAFDYDNQVEQSWIKEQAQPKCDRFAEDDVEYIEVAPQQ